MVVPIFNDQIILCFLLNNSYNLRLCGIRNMNTDASNDFKHFMSFCIYSIMPTNDVKSKNTFEKQFFRLIVFQGHYFQEKIKYNIPNTLGHKY